MNVLKNREIVIFANSAKHRQHCVAGKCSRTGQWIRPVSNEQGKELSDKQILYKNPHGQFTVKPLQKIIMSFSQHAPLKNQPENFIIDGGLWRQNYNITKENIEQYLDYPDDLWGHGNRICYLKIDINSIEIEQSLYLVKVDNLNLYCDNDTGKPKASFLYNKIQYELPVTDPFFKHLINDTTDLKSYLCISLGEVFEGYCYKLVAAIF